MRKTKTFIIEFNMNCDGYKNGICEPDYECPVNKTKICCIDCNNLLTCNQVCINIIAKEEQK